MKRIFISVFGNLSALASFLGLYFSIIPYGQPRPEWHWLALSFGTVVLFGVAVLDGWTQWSILPKRYRKPAKINAYMHRWIRSGGRSVIFSRDMSWANNSDTRRVLLEKAANNELTLCIFERTELSEELNQEGANIIEYGSIGHIPRSRFTIVDYGKEGARVAIGARLNGVHVIEEFQSGHHPLFAVAEDLIKILERTAEAGRV